MNAFLTSVTSYGIILTTHVRGAKRVLDHRTGPSTEFRTDLRQSNRAVGLTFVSFSRLMACHRDKPLTISLERLRNLPENLLPIVMGVITTPPVSDFLTAELAVAPRVPPLPELAQMQAVIGRFEIVPVVMGVSG